MIKRVTMVILTMLIATGIASAADQIAVDPSTVLDIDVGAIGHFTLTLKTSADAKGGNLDWASDNSLIWAGIDGAPTGQFGVKAISTSSTCSGTPQICTQTFDLQVEPQSGITLNEQHDITVTYKNAKGVAKAMATASGNPIPELSTIALTSAGLIGLIGLVRFRRKD